MQFKIICNNIKKWFIDAYSSIRDYFKKLLKKENEIKQPEQDIHIVGIKVTGIKIKKKTN